ncbi:MAG TPA: ABC transporter permease [Acidimicrobiales bacterium]|nr:ABC transporter permease [Acidimicrobiales bacterium]
MATTGTATVTTTTARPTPSRVVPTHQPERRLAGDLRAVKIVWQRELARFMQDRTRIVAQVVQPILFLFVLGTGLTRLASGGTHGVSLRTFFYPGILGMAVMFTAIFSAASIVWDREFGFLREMLVAPVRRGSIVIGKCLGGATVAGIQGLIIVAMAGLVNVPYDPVMIIEIIGLQLLLAFTLTAFGIMVSARITQMTSFMALVQMLIMPLYFISGAMFPVAGLPTWLAVLNRVDPLTYAVDPIRRVVFAHLQLSAAARRALVPGISWGSFHLSVGLEAAVVALLGVILLAIGLAEFNRTDT